MKKIILTAMAVFCLIGVSNAQTTKPPIKSPSKDSTYLYTVTVGADDYRALNELSNGYKNSIIYDPKVQDSKSVQQNIDMFLFGLSKRIKIDSVKVKIPVPAPKQ